MMWTLWSVSGLSVVLAPQRFTLGTLAVFIHSVFVTSHSGFHYANRLAVDEEALAVGVALQGNEHVLAVLEGNEAHALVADWHKSSERFSIGFQEGMDKFDAVDCFFVTFG